MPFIRIFKIEGETIKYKIKKSVKILGVYFTYDRRLKRILSFDEINKTIKNKLRIWKWRDLTILGKIQLVETFIILTFFYPASIICMDNESVNEINKIIFDFLWRGKDKVECRVLVGDIEEGGLKAPLSDLKEYFVVKTLRLTILAVRKLFFITKNL